MSVKYKPLNGRVLVRREAQAERSAGGIILADVAKDVGKRGTVLAASGWTDAYGNPQEPLVAPGDVVTFGKYSGVELQDLGPEFEDCLLFPHEEIQGVLGAEDGVELEAPQKDVAEEE